MNRIITLIAAIIVAFSPISAYAAKPKPTKATVVYSTNLHCQNCAKKINENIAFEKGVTDLKVDLEKQTITITYDMSKTSKENLAKAIEKLGYKAEEKPQVKKIQE